MTREPLTVIFVFVFPVVTMLIIGGSFGTTPDAAFSWVNPAHWYVASYLTVVIGATGLIMVPVSIWRRTANAECYDVLPRLVYRGGRSPWPRW